MYCTGIKYLLRQKLQGLISIILICYKIHKSNISSYGVLMRNWYVLYVKTGREQVACNILNKLFKGKTRIS